MDERAVIVGGGPLQSACVRRLRDLGHERFVVLEAAAIRGGLAASATDPAGFTWGRSGHVVFSYYGEFDRMLAQVIGEELERWFYGSARADRRLPVQVKASRRHLSAGVLTRRVGGDDDRRLLVNEVNSGHGRSIRRAMSASCGEWIFHLDSDGQVDVGEFRLLRDQRSKADLVVGMRLRRHDPLHRLVLTRLIRATVSVLARQRVRDANVPFKLIHRSRLEHLCPSIPPAAFPLILIVLGAHRRIRFSSALIKPYEGIGARRG